VLELKIVNALRTLPPAAIAALAKGSSLRHCAHETRIFAQGDVADHVYAVVGGEGRVRIGSGDESGKNFMVEVFGLGDLFGEVAVIDGGVRTAGAVAEGKLTLLSIRAAVFLQALETAPKLGAIMSRLLAARIRRTYSLLETTMFETVEMQLARQLLYLAERDGRRVATGIRLRGRYRQADLADLLGVTTRSVITVLNLWRQRTLIDYDTSTGTLTLLDSAPLQELAQRQAA
jgi:CRP/FNR family transcriptional regulator, cyclic AMP receptor protein